MSLDFDENGFLKPYEIIDCDLMSLETIFVENFPNSRTRRSLFNNYLKYIHEFSNRITRNFIQWLDGSFVSQKENPNDIDFVTFIDYKTYELQEDLLDIFWSFSLEVEGLDAYLVKVYPKSHKKHHRFLEQRQEWIKTYSKTKALKNNLRFSKGFLDIKFT